MNQNEKTERKTVDIVSKEDINLSTHSEFIKGYIVGGYKEYKATEEKPYNMALFSVYPFDPSTAKNGIDYSKCINVRLISSNVLDVNELKKSKTKIGIAGQMVETNDKNGNPRLTFETISVSTLKKNENNKESADTYLVSKEQTNRQAFVQHTSYLAGYVNGAVMKDGKRNEELKRLDPQINVEKIVNNPDGTPSDKHYYTHQFYIRKHEGEKDSNGKYTKWTNVLCKLNTDNPIKAEEFEQDKYLSMRGILRAPSFYNKEKNEFIRYRCFEPIEVSKYKDKDIDVEDAESAKKQPQQEDQDFDWKNPSFEGEEEVDAEDFPFSL